LKLGVTPNYVSIKIGASSTSSQSAKCAVKKAERIWVQLELKAWFSKRAAMSHYLYLLRTELCWKLHRMEMDYLEDSARTRASDIALKKKNAIRNKLDLLCRRQRVIPDAAETSVLDMTEFKFHPRMVNFSSHTFTTPEEEILNKGMKFAPHRPLSHDRVKNLLVDCEVSLWREKNGTKQLVADNLRKNILTTSKPPLNNITTSSVHHLIETVKSKNLVISKSDKGNSIVIMDRIDYVDKCNNFISGNDFQLLHKDPTSSFQKKTHDVIHSCNGLFSTKEKSWLLQKNPLPPRLYGLIKLHKDNFPIRPVISSTSSPTHKLAAKLNHLIKDYTKFTPKYGIKNSLDLIERLKDLKVPLNAKLISFDVNSLFTKVPKNDVPPTIRDHLLNNQVNPVIIEEILELTNTCLNQNYFLFNNDYFQQLDGLAMGSPLSPLLAEMFMDEFESNLFNSGHDLTKHVHYWHRYVDDVLCCWTGTTRQLEHFFTYINSRNNNIKFTMELGNKSINYLDLNIQLIEGKHVFDIYRKPTSTDVIIPADSCHPPQHKTAAFHSLINRLTKIPLSEHNYNKEWKTILHIAKVNGYQPAVIENILNKARKKQALSMVSSLSPINTPKMWCKIPFLGKISHSVTSCFPREKYRIAYYTPSTLKTILFNCKDRFPPEEKSGIYCLKCHDCEVKYIGRTERSVKIRVSEHNNCYKKKKEQSNFANHLLDSNHHSDFTPDILHSEGNRRRLDALEMLEIIQHLQNNTPLANEQVLPSHSPLFSIPINELLQ
jgi:hypothetical protein